MRDGWTETALGDVADVNMGQSPPGDTYNAEGIGMPFMQGSAEFGEHYPEPVKFCSAPAKIAEIGDLLLSVRAPVGDSNFANQRIAIGRGLATVRAKSGADTNFLRLVIQLNTAGLLATSGTGMFSSITGKNLREFGVNLPPLAEQKRIVDVVSSVDAYIDALQKQAETARKARNAVLHELLSAGGDDWTETTLGNIAKFVRGPFGGSLKKEIFVQSGFAVYEQQHAIYGDFVNFRYFVNKEKFDEMKRFSVSTGDLLMSCSGTVGKVSLVPPDAPAGIINQALLKISTSSQVSSAFLLYWTQSEIFHLLIQENSGGAVQQNVSSVKLLKDIRITLPPIDEQKRIAEIVSAMDDVIQSTEQAVTDAKNLRSGLLSDLLSGEHEIPAS